MYDWSHTNRMSLIVEFTRECENPFIDRVSVCHNMTMIRFLACAPDEFLEANKSYLIDTTKRSRKDDRPI